MREQPRPEEHEVCAAESIRASTFTAAAAALRERRRERGAAGCTHFSIRIRHGHPEMLEPWADVFAGV